MVNIKTIFKLPVTHMKKKKQWMEMLKKNKQTASMLGDKNWRWSFSKTFGNVVLALLLQLKREKNAWPSDTIPYKHEGNCRYALYY